MKFALFAMVLMSLAASSLATHFRYQTLYWERSSAANRTITVTIKQAWRLSAYGNPAVGAVVTTGSMAWGDGTSFSVAGTVTSRDTTNDWFTIQQVISKTYSGTATTFNILYSDCCRISTLKEGNNDRSMIISNTVKLGSTDPLRSPQIASLPLIPFTLNRLNQVQLPLVKDEKNNAVTFSIPTGSSSGLVATKPSSGGFNISSAGLISWTPSISGLYAFQTIATATNGNSVALDVVLFVSTAQVDTSPPYWTAPTQTTINYTPGTLVTFPVAAQEDEVDNIRVQAGSLPPGATLSGCTNSPVNGKYNPCTTTFSWQTAATSGDVIVCFQANDDAGNYAPQLCITLIANVVPVANPCAAGNCAVKSVAASCAEAGTPIVQVGTGKCATLSFAGTSTQC